jgi:hypothetical protein
MPAKPANAALRDWLFAKNSKRLLLEALLADRDRRWTRSELAGVSGQHAKARMDLHLGPLLEAGLLQRDGNEYRVVAEKPIAAILAELLRELGAEIPT